MPNHSALSRRILIVDDEPTLAYFLQQSLKESGYNYVIDISASGEDAQTKLERNRYDLLITDFMMPGITGLMLVDIARSICPGIKVVLMTAYGSSEMQMKTKALPVDGYLAKPFAVSLLRELIQTLFVPDHSATPVQT
jgi:CheY-like chemotaxis protein